MKSRAEQLMEIEAPGRGLLWMERLLCAAFGKSGYYSFIRTDIPLAVAVHFVDGSLLIPNAQHAEIGNSNIWSVRARLAEFAFISDDHVGNPAHIN